MTHDITDEQIATLRAEAASAGDRAQVAICEIALRAEEAWWTWHDADAARWEADEDDQAATMRASARCAAWTAGLSDDGPDAVAARAECARVIGDAQAMQD